MLRMTPEDFDNLRGRIKAATQKRQPIHRPRQKRTKYGNEITYFDGKRFDSKSEAQRYIVLKEMEKSGKIKDLRTQVVFDLIPSLELDGRREKGVKYIADFVYFKDGKEVIEDVKSAPTKTKEFVIKRKLMAYLHNKVVQEVLMD